MLKKLTDSLHSQGHLYESKRNWLDWNLNTARCFHLSDTLPMQLFEISTSSNILLQANSLDILNSNFSQFSFCDIRPPKKKIFVLSCGCLQLRFWLFCDFSSTFINSQSLASFNEFTKYFSLFRTYLCTKQSKF